MKHFKKNSSCLQISQDHEFYDKVVTISRLEILNNTQQLQIKTK
jgi:hypothetical protein